tara:strand:- start:2910 stop:3338 length:429 start_codon:yes stop_codon:yes gene_type:complete
VTRAATAGISGYVGLLLVAYLVSGSLRATVFDQLIGAPSAAALEGLWLVSAGLSGAALIPLPDPGEGLGRVVLAGAVAASAFLCMDALVAEMLCGISLERHLSRFTEPAGWIQALSLTVACLAPLLMLILSEEARPIDNNAG